MENKKIVLVKPQCSVEIRSQFMTRFGEQCEFIFQDSEHENAIEMAEIKLHRPMHPEPLERSLPSMRLVVLLRCTARFLYIGIINRNISGKKVILQIPYMEKMCSYWEPAISEKILHTG